MPLPKAGEGPAKKARTYQRLRASYFLCKKHISSEISILQIYTNATASREVSKEKQEKSDLVLIWNATSGRLFQNGRLACAHQD